MRAFLIVVLFLGVSLTATATPLCEAARIGDANIINVATANGVNPNERSSGGSTPLFLALLHNHIDAARALIGNGAEVDLEYESITSLLHQAALYPGREAFVELFLMAKANPNKKDEYGNTPLHYAALHGRSTVVALLVANEADIAAKNDADLTPYQVANPGLHQIALALLRNGPNMIPVVGYFAKRSL